MRFDSNGILSDKFNRLIVENKETGEQIAVITPEFVETFSDDIIVRLRPTYEEN